MRHIELARWADAIVISPCSADSLAKLAAGGGDDLMSAVCLAADSKIFFAPAMKDSSLYVCPSTCLDSLLEQKIF